jgi:hypothetical protein
LPEKSFDPNEEKPADQPVDAESELSTGSSDLPIEGDNSEFSGDNSDVLFPSGDDFFINDRSSTNFYSDEANDDDPPASIWQEDTTQLDQDDQNDQWRRFISGEWGSPMESETESNSPAWMQDAKPDQQPAEDPFFNADNETPFSEPSSDPFASSPDETIRPVTGSIRRPSGSVTRRLTWEDEDGTSGEAPDKGPLDSAASSDGVAENPFASQHSRQADEDFAVDSGSRIPHPFAQDDEADDRPDESFWTNAETGETQMPDEAANDPISEQPDVWRSVARSRQAGLYGLEDSTRSPEDESNLSSIDNLRRIVLEDYDASGGHVYQNQHDYSGLTGGNSVKDWWTERTGVEKVLLVVVILLALTLLTIVPLAYFRVISFQAPPAPTAVSSQGSLEIAYPVGLRLPGGWYFDLTRSDVTDGQWQPERGEWLEGSEIRRIVALPWNLQLEAVVQTLQPGDLIDLNMDNGQIVTYQVEDVSKVARSYTDFLNEKTPALIVILALEDTEDRWVVVSTPLVE